MTGSNPWSGSRLRRPFVLLLGGNALSRFLLGTQVPLSGDELMPGQWSRHLALGYPEHPPLLWGVWKGWRSRRDPGAWLLLRVGQHARLFQARWRGRVVSDYWIARAEGLSGFPQLRWLRAHLGARQSRPRAVESAQKRLTRQGPASKGKGRAS